jgi:hypothetical protein
MRNACLRHFQTSDANPWCPIKKVKSKKIKNKREQYIKSGKEDYCWKLFSSCHAPTIFVKG